jgi:GT2 family glycosyltransferase
MLFSHYMIKISAVIITYNEERNIGRCIESAKAVADEVVVLDSLSTDRTKDICLEKGVRFFEQEFLGYARQKNRALSHASHDIILSLDADEYLSSELTQSILGVKAHWDHDGYIMNRLSSLGGTWIKTCGWYPDQKLRLWDRRKGKWEGDAVHERVEMFTDATLGYLKGDMFHRSYDNISQFLHKNQIYSTIHAHVNRYRSHSSVAKIFYKTLFAFFKAYILKAGITDGYKGLVISGSTAHWVFYKYAKLLEANNNVRTSLLILHEGSTNELLIRMLNILRVQTELPDEIVITSNKSTKLEESHIAQFPIPVKELVIENGVVGNDILHQVMEEYLIVVKSNTQIDQAFISRHRKLAWREQVVIGWDSQRLLPSFSWQTEARNGPVSFWREDVDKTLVYQDIPVATRPMPVHQVEANKKSVSVVIPNYNGKHLFEQTLPPLFDALKNALLDYEVIVVDDCSTDNSVDFLQQSFPQVRVIRNEVNLGFSPTINRGIRAATKDLVHLLNSDVKLLPDYYVHLLPYFQQDDTFGVMGRIVNWDDDGIQDGAKLPTFQGAKIKTFKNYLPSETPFEKGILTMYLSGAEALVDKRKLLTLGGFDELFAPYYIEDYELSLRAWRMGWKCYYEHMSVCRHKTSSSIRSKSRKRQIQTVYYRNKIFLHAIHLPQSQMILYYPQLLMECLVRLISFRFHYLQSIFLFLRDREKCKVSRARFEALLATSETRQSLQQVASGIQQSLNRSVIWRF